MPLLSSCTQLRGGRPLAAAVATVIAISAGEFHPGDRRDQLVRDADVLCYRLTEGRLGDRFEHRALRRREDIARAELLSLQATATAFRERWYARSDTTAGRKWAEAQLLAGNAEAAAALLVEVLERESGHPDHLAAIHHSRNAALLTDFSAAMLQRPGKTSALVLAFEAADRAWQLARTPQAAWNCALAAERIGAPAAALRAWRNAAALETSPRWRREAAQREHAATQFIRAAPESPELFFHRRLIATAAAGGELTDLLPGDRLASDTANSISMMTARDRKRFRSALETFANGRDAFDREDLDSACGAYWDAERALASMGNPQALLVREQRIRCGCAQAQSGCLESIHAFRAEVASLKRYPWLAARAVYAEGQALYRQGRIYEAADAFSSALTAFLAVGDAASAGLTHSVLGNTYGAAGETDAALEHHLAAIRLRFQYAGDRRRIQLEDAMLFLLRHGYVATAELLLDEMSSAPPTEGGRVMEAVLRGVIAFRRGETRNSERQFERAWRFVEQITDAALRSEAKRSVLLAESGCNVGSSRRGLVDIDGVLTTAQQEETSLWLPRVLTERGIALETANEPGRAEADFLRAMSILERREPRIDQSSLTLGTSTSRQSAFDRAIRLYLNQGRITDALAVAQRSTSLRISSLHARGRPIRDVFRSGSGSSIDGTTVQDIRTVLPAAHVAIAQYLLDDAVITWIVTHSAVRVVRRQIAAERLIDAVNDLHSCASRDRCHERFELDLVSDLLLRDWIEQVPRGATIWLQRPIELQAVPFAMLKTRSGERLLSRNPLTNAPGFSSFVRAQRFDAMRDGKLSALFVAAPRPPGALKPLPSTVEEVRRAARFYETARVEVSAQRRMIEENALPYAVVHFAGHVLVNSDQPLFSALALDDGLFYVHEFDRRSFSNVRLVVLAGCDTGRTPKPGMSVANALLSQDVPSVVYTLWPVADVVTANFSVAFHRAITAGKSRAEALQYATERLWERYPDRMSAAAAFQLAGAPGAITSTPKGELGWQQ